MEKGANADAFLTNSGCEVHLSGRNSLGRKNTLSSSYEQLAPPFLLNGRPRYLAAVYNLGPARVYPLGRKYRQFVNPPAAPCVEDLMELQDAGGVSRRCMPEAT